MGRGGRSGQETQHNIDGRRVGGGGYIRVFFCPPPLQPVRSPPKGLVTNYGEGGRGYKWEEGAREVLPLQKGEAEKVLAMLKGGVQKVLG